VTSLGCSPRGRGGRGGGGWSGKGVRKVGGGDSGKGVNFVPNNYHCEEKKPCLCKKKKICDH